MSHIDSWLTLLELIQEKNDQSPYYRVGPDSEYGPNTEYRIIRFLKILPIPNTEFFGF